MFNNYIQLLPSLESLGIAAFVWLLIFEPVIALGLLIGHFIVFPMGKGIYRQLTGC